MQFCEISRLESGQQFDIERMDRGEYRLAPFA